MADSELLLFWQDILWDEWVKYEKFVNRHTELSRKHLKILKRRGIDPPFDQAKEVQGDTQQFRESFLAHLSRRTDCPNAITELFAEPGQANLYLSADFRSVSFAIPPNQITGIVRWQFPFRD